MEKEDNLPLFMTLYEPLAIYVLDNEILGCESVRKHTNSNIIMTSYDFGHGHISPGVAFLFLKIIYQNEACRKAFPTELIKHFEKIKDQKLPSHYSSFMRCFEYGNKKHSIHLSMKIAEEKSNPKPVTLYNFSYESELLDKTIHLNPTEAFFILANICTNAFCRGILPLAKKSFEKLLFRQIIRKSNVLHQEVVAAFIVDYLKYIRKEFKSGKITPSEILRYSGARLLQYLSQDQIVQNFIKQIIDELEEYQNLSRNKKIMYFTLMMLFSKQSNAGHYIKKFYNNRLVILESLANELYVPFPKLLPLAETTKITNEEYTETYMPLFWFQEQPVEIYVLKNKLLGIRSDSGSFDNGSPNRGYKLLLDLLRVSNVKDSLPEFLTSKLAVTDSKDLNPPSSLYSHLLGWDDPYAQVPFLNLDIKKKENQGDTIVFHNITYNTIPLDIEIELSEYQSFILLANIVASRFVETKIGVAVTSDNFLDNVGDKPKLEQFVLHYLKYLSEEIKANRITLMDILRLSGAGVLTLLSVDFPIIENFIKKALEELKSVQKLSLNRKLMYFTLIEMCYDKISRTKEKVSLFDTIKQFYEDYYSIIHVLRNLFCINFPFSEKQTLNWLLKFENSQEQKTKDIIIQPIREVKIPLPLFLYFGKFQLYVVNNELMIYEQNMSSGSGNRAFNLLKELFNNEKTKVVFPEDTHHILVNTNDLAYARSNPCIVGDIMPKISPCLKLKMNISKDGKTITFSDFLYKKEKEMQKKAQLTTKETFILLSNIVLTYELYQIQGVMVNKQLTEFNKEIILEDITKRGAELAKHLGSKHIALETGRYATEYLSYLMESINNGSLSPEEIHRMSGTAVLISLIRFKPVKEYILDVLKRMENVNELTKNELVLYLVLLESLSFNSPLGKEVQDFYKRNSKMISNIHSYLKTISIPEKVAAEKPKSKSSKFVIPNDILKDYKEEQKQEDPIEIPEEKTMPIKEAIEEAKKRENKIILIKADTYMNALQDIGKALVGPHGIMNYPTLYMNQALNNLMNDRKIPQMKRFVGDIIFNPPLTQEEVNKSIAQILSFHETGEMIHPTTKEKVKVTMPKINPEYKDYLIIGFFFKEMVRKGQLDNYHINLFTETIIQLSKKKLIILPHPYCDIDDTMSTIIPGMKIVDIPKGLFDKLLNLAVIASDEPNE